MGRQKYPPFFTGRVNDLVGYKRGDRYYVRSASSLTAEKVKQDAAFDKTRYQANIMATASRLASTLHGALPREQRNQKRYYSFLRHILAELKAGTELATVRRRLLQELSTRMRRSKLSVLRSLLRKAA